MIRKSLYCLICFLTFFCFCVQQADARRRNSSRNNRRDLQQADTENRYPESVEKRCRNRVSKEKVADIKVKYGQLRINTQLNGEKLHNICHKQGKKVSMCSWKRACILFEGVSSHIVTETTETSKMGMYRCAYFSMNGTYNIKNVTIYLDKTLTPTEMRLALRHELQHFYYWLKFIEDEINYMNGPLAQYSKEHVMVCKSSNPLCGDKDYVYGDLFEDLDYGFAQEEIKRLDFHDRMHIQQDLLDEMDPEYMP